MEKKKNKSEKNIKSDFLFQIYLQIFQFKN